MCNGFTIIFPEISLKFLKVLIKSPNFKQENVLHS